MEKFHRYLYIKYICDVIIQYLGDYGKRVCGLPPRKNNRGKLSKNTGKLSKNTGKLGIFDITLDLTKLIETTYASNGNKSIIMVSHSMGSIMTLFLMNHKSQEWKDKYIRSHISMSGVWGGSE